MFATKRIYESASADDGYRVLVDRLWPRGVSKERASLDEWMRDIGPSDALRKWFHHEDAHWDEFVERYETELGGHPDELDHLRALEEEHGKVTLLYGARDAGHNQAVVLKRTLARPAS